MVRQFIFFSLGLLCLALLGCKKGREESAPQPEGAGPGRVVLPGSIIGNWELRGIEGGYRAPGSPNTYPAGNGNIWKFGPREYRYYRKEQLLDQGGYQNVKDSSAATGRLMDALLFANNNIVHYEIKADTLVMYRGIIAADGTIERYVYIDSLR